MPIDNADRFIRHSATRRCLPLIIVTGIFAVTTSAHAAEVFAREGQIVLRDGAREIVLTQGPQDSSPLLAPDGELVVFSRETDQRMVVGACCEGERPKAHALWAVQNDGANAHLLISPNEGGKGDMWYETVVTGFLGKKFSDDSRYLFYLTPAWVTSTALRVYDFDTGEDRFIAPANDFELLTRCADPDLRGLIVVNQRRYHEGDGPSFPYVLIDMEGKEIRVLGKSPEMEAC